MKDESVASYKCKVQNGKNVFRVISELLDILS